MILSKGAVEMTLEVELKTMYPKGLTDKISIALGSWAVFFFYLKIHLNFTLLRAK